jgi:Holliday junction resolvase RusA-like endonuclease
VIHAEPPSGNHYKNFRVIDTWTMRNGQRVKRPIPQWYDTPEAKTWWRLVERATDGRQLVADSYELSYIVFQGHGSRGDVDNYAKPILDGLVKAGVLRNDSLIVDFHGHKRRDRQNPRTVIVIRASQQQLFSGDAA